MAEKYQVSVKLFGAFRKYGNGQVLAVNVNAGARVRDLRSILAQQIAELPNGEPARDLVFESALADETQILGEEDLLRPGQVLAILPPVCGG